MVNILLSTGLYTSQVVIAGFLPSTVSSHGTIDCPPRILNLFVSAIIYRWKDTRRDAEEFSITGDVGRRAFRSPQLVVKWPKDPGLGTVVVCPDLYSPENERMSRENQWLGDVFSIKI